MEGSEVTRSDVVARGADDPAAGVAPMRQLSTRSRIIAHLKCHMCGRSAGAVEGNGDRFPKPGPGDIAPVGNWRKLRCETCGGSLYVDEVEKVHVHKELTAEQLFGSEPRKTRPRKREPRETAMNSS